MPLEGLAAGMPGMPLEGLVDWNAFGRSCRLDRRSLCLLCVECLFWIEGLFALCM